MDTKKVIVNTVFFVKQKLKDAEAGHDWWHIERVRKNALHIAEEEGVDLFVVELGALLHDIADSKFHDGDEDVGPKTAQEFLESQNVSEGVVVHVENIVRHISFKGSQHKQSWMSPELAVVQDADRLDSIGAIGIARVFTYGGYKNRELYNPEIEVKLELTREEYRKHKGTTINHFYEKLLLLKDLMNTKTGKQLARSRHEFMKAYLTQFYAEWNGEK
ncbi:MAG: HD domain-containing protein [Candidatus Paceibacterota bacterium]